MEDIYIKNTTMTKIILTEGQLKKLTKKLTEGTIKGNEYEDSVSVDVETYGVKVNGEDIDWASCADMRLTYDIHIEFASWGIDSIYLTNIKGPSEIEIEITPQTDEQQDDVYLNLPYDWENVTIEEEQGSSVTVGREITIKLKNDESGKIVIESITVPVYKL
jgi:hypothetical protein